MTKNPASSTEPAIAAHGDGHVFAWIDDRVIPAGLFVQRLDPLGSLIGNPRQIPTGDEIGRPRLASTGKLIVLAYTETIALRTSVKVQVLNASLEPQLATPAEIATTDAAHGAGLVLSKGRFLVALAQEQGLRLHELELRPRQSTGDAGVNAAGDGGDEGAGDSVAVEVTTRDLPLGEGLPALGNVDLTVHRDRLFLSADHPEGWSIVIAEIGRDEVRRVAQVIDDRRNPDSRWSLPTIGPAGEEHLALMWQGPGMGLTALFLLEFDLDGHPVGTERPFEAIVRDEEERAIGRAPAFHPSLAPTPGGLVAAFADNRFTNSEILLASFSCGGAQ